MASATESRSRGAWSFPGAAVADRGLLDAALKTRMAVTAIVPAHNEEKRIGRVIEALLAADDVDDVIVVNDGSTDKTSEVARGYCPRIRVVDLEANRGKGGAMLAGARCAEDSDIVLFLDGDLIGLSTSHVRALIEPVLSGECDMAVGQFKGGRGLTDLAQLLVPYISGQRCIRRELFMQIPDLDTVGYGIEMAITYHVKYLRGRVRTVILRGVTHPMKEEKLGYLRGSLARWRMYAQMFRFGIRYAIAKGKRASGKSAL
jgi:glycosyltransferase involved in cell wall biosynthesis